MWIEKNDKTELIPPKKTVDIIVSGPGHIAPIENCSITADISEIMFCNPSANACVNVVPDDNDGKCNIHMGNFTLPANTTSVMFDADSDYGIVYFDFS